MLSVIARYEDSIRRPQEQRWTLVTGQPRWRSNNNHLDPLNPVQGIKPLDFDSYYKYAVRCFEYLKFGSNVDQAIRGTYPFYEALYVCQTPTILELLGWQQNSFFHTQKHLRKEIAPVSRNGHALPVETIKQIPELLEQPVAVFDSLTRHDSSVVLLDANDPAGNPLNVALQPNGNAQHGGRQSTGGIVLSVYGRQAIDRFLQRNAENQTVKYVDKEKIKKLIPSAELQLRGTYMSFVNSSVQHSQTDSQPQTREDLTARISGHISDHPSPSPASPSISPERPKL
ncbi:MuF-C-terminal domain-containing protein [Arcanobacterium buesumense]|uniref:MuF-C-terminal domain-containing protein n=1 Tax=Arcanobacterium buesumense TaxID=2722751 RepID=UPI001B3AE973|nr:hypothetical protein [Arcanobacterium buesumense]